MLLGDVFRTLSSQLDGSLQEGTRQLERRHGLASMAGGTSRSYQGASGRA
jgi:hypothetical protein